jgi:putative NADH-flavin reductase
MNVLVIGGTRGVGHAVVVAAHAAGHTMTVMARTAAGFDGPVSGIRMVAGDAEDAADVDRAIAGQEAVVWTVGVAGNGSDVRVFSRGTGHVLKAMADHRVRRLVCVTGVAAGNNVSRAVMLQRGLVGPVLGRAVDADKARQEAQIRESTLDWTIVRPAPLTSARATGLYQTLTEPVAGRAKRIPRADVADFIVDNLAAPDYVRKIVFLTA